MSRRADRRLRGKLGVIAGGATVAATTLVGNTAAYAGIQSFENSGLAFQWTYNTDLDITRGALDQALADAQTSFWQESFAVVYQYTLLNGRTGPARVSNYDDGFWGNIVVAFGPGATIGPTADFADAKALGAINYGLDAIYVGNAQREYVGVRFEDALNQTHYGWIDVMWNPTARRFDAYAWGYETDADTPIRTPDVPEPGTLALFALGAVAGAVALRRRRKAGEAEEE